jgi:bis(5'-nucleosyl)-tetraphosphatase (symmetrical)
MRMTTYAIGDLQGCLAGLRDLLKHIDFNEQQDTLWLTGDLVNRGPESLETLRFLMHAPFPVHTVLGNHDLALLAVAHGALPYEEHLFNFKSLLDAPDRDVLIHWLQTRPLLHYNPQLNYLMVHAGILPIWDLQTIQALAQEAEALLQGPHKITCFQYMYGNTPTQWDPTLQGWDRWRFILNALTRLRFCTPTGELEFETKENMAAAPPGYLPWFMLPSQLPKNLNVIFGHWSTLQGKTPNPQLFALDTGYVWGGPLTALCLETQQRFSILPL